jgi:hypothetical protein
MAAACRLAQRRRIELQKNEVKQLKRLSHAQNNTLRARVEF